MTVGGFALAGMPPALLLGLSVAVLALGPLSLALLERHRNALQVLDGFVLVSVAGLVLADVIPHAFEQGGWIALPLVLAGLIGPALLERSLGKAARRVHNLTLLVGLSGLVLHAGIDGVALASAGSEGVSANIATAVLLHRLPEGLTIWWLLRPSHGRLVAAGTLALVAASTAAGMSAIESRHSLQESGALAYVGALVGGSLLHVIIHRSHPMVHTPPAGRWRWASGVGGLAGVALLAVILAQGGEHAGHGHLEAAGSGHETGWGELFLHLARESAPALLLAYVAAGLVQVALPSASIAWMRRGGHLRQSLKGMLFGLPLPICSCGVVPVYRSLVLQGVPAAAALSFLVATPELGLDAVLLSIPLLGGKFAVVRLLAAALVALGVGWFLGWAAGRGADLALVPPTDSHEVEHLAHKDGPSLGARMIQGLRVGLGEVVDHTGPWVLLGLAVAALAQPLLEGGALARLSGVWEVPLLALAGMPVYVCASGATPLVAVLIANGVSPGAGLAFLLTGPATNVTTFGLLARLHNRRLALAFGATIALLAVGLGWGVDALLPDLVVPALAATSAEDHGILPDIALGVLALLLAASLLRQGPRRFLGQVLAFANGDAQHEGHDHAHDDDHGHDHAGDVEPVQGHAASAEPKAARHLAGSHACSDGCAPQVRVVVPRKPGGGCGDGCGH